MGYSWDIHGVFICVGYVSGMYRVCIGNVTDEKSSEEVRIQATETHRNTQKNSAGSAEHKTRGGDNNNNYALVTK